MVNEEWTGGPRFIAGGCGNEWRKEWRRERVVEIRIGFFEAFARANHSLDERSEVLKHSLERTLCSLERTTLWMKALEQTRVCLSDHFSVWVRSSDHFSVWVRSSELESARANLILDRVLFKAKNLVQLVLDFVGNMDTFGHLYVL